MPAQKFDKAITSIKLYAMADSLSTTRHGFQPDFATKTIQSTMNCLPILLKVQ